MEKIKMKEKINKLIEQAAPQAKKWELNLAAPQEEQMKSKQIVINEYDPNCKIAQYNVMYGGTLFQVLNPPEEYNQNEYDDNLEYEYENDLINEEDEE